MQIVYRGFLYFDYSISGNLVYYNQNIKTNSQQKGEQKMEKQRILTEEEIYEKLRTAGKKRSKQLITKLIKLRGGKPILHFTSKNKTISDEGYCFYEETSYWGFTSIYKGNLTTDYEAHTSISGNFTEADVLGIMGFIKPLYE